MLKPLPLPYPPNALSPYISRGALELHYGLYRGYVQRVNEMSGGSVTREDLEPLLMVLDPGDKLFEQAAQAWSHEELFASMRPATGTAGVPHGPLAQMIRQEFGSVVNLCERVRVEAGEVFGSGWVWVCWHPERGLVLHATAPTGVPLRHGLHPLIVVDVWEHAYLLDYGADRLQYVWEFFDMLVNWRVADYRLRRAMVSTQKQMRELPSA